MVEDVKELELDQELRELAASCASEEDFIKAMNVEPIPEGESDELSEGDLEIVAGGMSNTNAIIIVLAAYYAIVAGKKSCGYSSSQIKEACNICRKLNSKVQKWAVKTLAQVIIGAWF